MQTTTMYRVTMGDTTHYATTSEYRAVHRARAIGTGALPATVEVRTGRADSAQWAPVFEAWRGGERCL